MNWNEVFKYDVESPSCLIWNCNIPYRGTYGDALSYKRVVGDVAGTYQKSANRYKVKYQQKAYMVHRIIYALFHGEVDPKMVIDHIDGDCGNNRIENLRLVTQDVNARNTKKRSTNKTGVNGVSYSEVVSEYGATYRYFCAHWLIEKKMFNKYYSINKLGNEEAFRLACEYRERMIAMLNEQGAGYTHDHGKR